MLSTPDGFESGSKKSADNSHEMIKNKRQRPIYGRPDIVKQAVDSIFPNLNCVRAPERRIFLGLGSILGLGVIWIHFFDYLNLICSLLIYNC